MGRSPESFPTPVDQVTGFLDRSEFRMRLCDMLSDTGPGTVALILLDIARFNEINTAFGLSKGDELLGKVARRIRKAVPKANAFGRLSSNEFAVLIETPAETEITVAALLEIFARPIMVSGQDLRIRVHIGSAETAVPAPCDERLLTSATIALNRAKKSAQAHIRFVETPGDLATDMFRIESDLRATLIGDDPDLSDLFRGTRLFPVFQPKVDLLTGHVASVEALARWRDETGRIVGPAVFVPVAERAGLMDALGLWVMKATVSALRHLPGNMGAAVNVSPCQMKNHESFSRQLQRSLETAGVAPGRLELEITENVLGQDIEAGVNALSSLGLKLWVDDFGTGEASLARLVTLPFSGVKLDKSIVDTMAQGKPGRAERLIGAIAAIAFSQSMETVAEGVEHAWQVERLSGMSIDYGQGFFFAPPMELDELRDFLASSTPRALTMR